MEVVATAGRGKQVLNGTGQPIPHVDHPHGSFKGSFDIDDGSFISRPRTLVAIAIGMFVIGGGVALMHYRLGNIEAAVNAIPDAIDRRIEQSEVSSDQQRRIDCLQQQIANKSWVCPYAVQIAKEPEPRKRAGTTTTTKKPDTGFWSAFAGGK